MASVDDVQKFLDEQWTVLTWSDEDEATYHALAIHPTETTQHAMEQEGQIGNGSTLSEALCCLVEKMADKSGSESDATKDLRKVVVRLVEWDEECMRVDHRSPLSEGMISEARAALELAK